MTKSSPFYAWGLLLALALVWGSSFILIKIGLTGLSAEQVGLLRIVSAFLFLLPVSLVNIKKIKKSQWSVLLVIGLFGSLLPALLFAKAQTALPSSVAGILNALTPLFTLIIGILFFVQRLDWKIMTGLLIGLAGSIYLIIAGSAEGLSGINYHALLVILATIFYGANLNIIKFKLSELGSRAITSISLLLVGPFAFVYLFFMTDFSAQLNTENMYPVLAVVILGVLGTAIALIFFNELVKISTPVFASSVTYIIPIVAVIWGLIDGETLQIHHYIGMMLIIAGVYLTNRAKRTAGKEIKI